MNKDLFLFHNDNGVFEDHSKASRDFLRDSFTIDFVSAEDEIYIGLYKPFYSFYVELTALAIGAGLSFEYFDGSSWQFLEVDDQTNDFTRSGFMSWQREIEDWASSEVNSVSKYWVRVKAQNDFTGVFDGLNLVFSDDNDLLTSERKIQRQLAKGDKSFIAYHVGARDEIIQRFRNSGNVKRLKNASQYQNITKWDVLEVGDIRQASKHLTLAKIMFDVSEANDDKYYKRFKDYMSFFGSSFDLFLERLDHNDDGKKDTKENNSTKTLEITKS